MATKPTKYPEWALVDTPDPVYGGNNVVEPTAQRKNTGYLKEYPTPQYLNWVLRTNNEWIQYFDEHAVLTGDYRISLRSDARPGWVLVDDGSIGNAASGATTRANADTNDLFILMYTSMPDSICPVSGGRTGSGSTPTEAQTDFDANKTLTLNAMLGRALGIAGAGAGLTTRTLGETVGAETHQLTVAELAEHDHSHNHTITTGYDNFAGGSNDGLQESGIADINFTSTTDATTAGSDTAHNNMQPSSFINIYLKL